MKKDKKDKKNIPSSPKNFFIGGPMYGLDAASFIYSASFDEANTNSNGSPLTDLILTNIYGDSSIVQNTPIEFPGISFGMNVPATSANGGGHVSTTIIIPAPLGYITAGNTWSVHLNSLRHQGAPSNKSPYFIDRTNMTSSAPEEISTDSWVAEGGLLVHITLEYKEPVGIHDGTPFQAGYIALANTHFYTQIDNETPVRSESIAATSPMSGGVITRTFELPIADGTKANVRFWATANTTSIQYDNQQNVWFPVNPPEGYLIPPFPLNYVTLTLNESENSNIATQFVERSLVPGAPSNFTIG